MTCGPERAPAWCSHVVFVQMQTFAVSMVILPPLWDGVARVHHEIHDHLLDLSGIGLGGTESGIRNCLKLDILADQAAQHLVQIARSAS